MLLSSKSIKKKKLKFCSFKQKYTNNINDITNLLFNLKLWIKSKKLT